MQKRPRRPFTVRLAEATERWIEREAKRTKLSKGALLQNLAEESIRMRRFPGLAFRGPEHGRRPWVIGTALDVWEIIEAYRAMGMARLLAEGDVPESKVQLALRYYETYPDEIDQAIAENKRSEEEWRRLYPSVASPMA